jgi:hypothetical protein
MTGLLGTVSVAGLAPTDVSKERNALIFKSYGVQKETENPLILQDKGTMLFRNVAELKPRVTFQKTWIHSSDTRQYEESL